MALFEWAGANALLLYTAAATPLLPALLAGVYYGDPANNLVRCCPACSETTQPATW